MVIRRKNGAKKKDKKNNKNKSRSFATTTLITLLIVVMLIFSQPANAVNVSISGLSGSIIQGTSKTFTITVTMENTDQYVPVSNVTLNLSGPTPKQWTFDPITGVIISPPGDTDISVSVISPPSPIYYGYGYGYGADTNEGGEGHNFGYGYGYGYDYGQGGGSVSFTYQVNLSTTNLATGSYIATASLNTGKSGKSNFVSTFATFTVSVATTIPTPPSPPPTSPPTLIVENPVNNQVFNTTSITVSGTASSSSGIRRVTVNDVPANGTTTWNTTITLVPGTNSITVVATDNAGNTAVVTVIVFCTAQTGGVLNVEANRRTVRTGASVSVNFMVTSNRMPVSGATVTLEGNASGSGTTDAFGSAVITVNATGAGTITATASKTGFVSGSTTLTARALEVEVEPFDTDGSGKIERSEALDCVTRFFEHGFVPGTNTPVTRARAVRVVVTFFTQPP